jgi:WXXGXW repeat (2 copies)
MQLPTSVSRSVNSTTVRSFLSATILTTTLLFPTPSPATEEILTNTPPPQSRLEREPPHRDGYAWAPGYWEWNGRFYHWSSGTWISERQGHWIPDHWDPVGTQWHYIRGHWER